MVSEGTSHTTNLGRVGLYSAKAEKILSNIDHPYRQRLNDLFNGRVQIYEKADVLQGAGFNADTVKEQLSVVVMSFDSLKATNKENRKAFQENGYLASFLNDDGEVTTRVRGAAGPFQVSTVNALLLGIRSEAKVPIEMQTGA